MTETQLAQLSHRLTHAVTAYDIKQSRRKGYNGYALSLYLGACQECMRAIKTTGDIRSALTTSFCGRLLDVVLRAVGETPSTDAEQRY